MVKTIFWLSIGIITYTYIGYPVVLVIISLFRIRPVTKKDIKPYVSLVISLHNEEKVISKKLTSCLELNYPKDKLEILIGLDGATDKTGEIIKQYKSKGVSLYAYEKRRGKPSVLNDLLSIARGDIIVFTDARQLLDKNAVTKLISNFADESVGCVSGEMILKSTDNSDKGLEGLGIYWNYEKFIRYKESSIHSMIGATGAIFAIRKKLFKPIPVTKILDDVYTPLSIVKQGYRAIFDRESKAYDKSSTKPGQEYKRKVRTLTGNYQIFAMFTDLFNPFSSPIAFQLFSHKLLRVLVPFFMMSIFVCSILLANDVLYAGLLICQIFLYLLAIRGGVVAKRKIGSRSFFDKLTSGIYTFCLLNFAALAGLYRYITNSQNIAWEK